MGNDASSIAELHKNKMDVEAKIICSGWRIVAAVERIDHRCRDDNTGTTHLPGLSLSSLRASYC